MLAHPDSPGKKAAKRFDGICINSSFNSEKESSVTVFLNYKNGFHKYC